ncbi:MULTISPECIES: CcoQ/FixQ family Cbb3-type cytochrome c oxidase assembly chaperone [Vibrio]|uniref:Cbb3-type cytochrome c oxidase subunit CcoQ n=1 Tax=Vibrio proteolyticus NBRC 13287 TaxID=1219065 RepID=U3BEX1_VIBPR|nr:MULTISPECIES: CcoQ/FixQ family Cbb3-type cytochrome c oxidase assembly chaperone [Vibrio]NAW60197.1 CcoQ/FixQ family Cbb3-type cytochrome c oxidase assembly chaperone [Vibrio sp. V36_P2S2PM302]NAX21572.1 CcoQ/FixQ family Cbb3-type cytochrome c oxidase assembly chaperone [Vibrio sp. V39_P1S14PM300]NAX28435.1 CcoQ/FixQ family Cbb3-type cytochrome c oxidase assembly chaperone [Vibrio sp. V38_P2S17PM301]NAX29561.1 CcoQ/FixQ family Cbb3-type cytochrome c oxidase assembly chaperone [Vibrio sp. V37
MDIGTIHSIWTIVIFVCFIGVVWWAFGKSRKSRFEEDANMIFADEEQAPSKEHGVTK